MKKIFKTILFVSLVGILFASQLVFAEEPSTLETDLQTSMSLIQSARQDEYVEFYQKILSTYAKKDLEPFKILHLKYLYLTNSETEFMNLLNEFPDNFVFKTYLEANRKKINFEDILKHKKNMSKKDLIGLWKKIHEIDAQVTEAIAKDDYSKVLKLVGSQQTRTSFINLDNAYASLEGIWASTLLKGYCGSTFNYKFLKEKDIPMIKYLVENFSKHDGQDNLMKLLKLDIDIFNFNENSESKIRAFDENLYTRDELDSFFKSIEMFQKAQLPLNKIYYEGKELAFVYSQVYPLEGSVIQTYDQEKQSKIAEFRSVSAKNLEYVSLSKNYIAVKFYAVDTYPAMNKLTEYFIFKKEKTGWKPVIRYKTYFEDNEC